jgi:hypothetical protein
MISPCTRVCLFLLLGLLTSCSSFDSRWKAAATNPAQQRWDGRWTSDKHHEVSGGKPESGRLRAVTEISPKKDLVAHFHANWLIFSADYSMAFQPKEGGSHARGAREFSGTQDLPKVFGGTYRYEATLSGNELIAHYKSGYDFGTFTLRRVGH